MHEAHKTIWLQIDPEGDSPAELYLLDGATWCQDKINDNDVEYILADQFRQAKVEVLREAAKQLHDYGNPWVSDGLRRMADEIEKGEQDE